jgi:hypothetical protein
VQCIFGTQSHVLFFSHLVDQTQASNRASKKGGKTAGASDGASGLRMFMSPGGYQVKEKSATLTFTRATVI